MKRTSLFAAFALGVALAASAHAATTYEPKNKSYKIAFPGAPTEEVDKSQSASGELTSVSAIYEDATKEGAYVSSYSDMGDVCKTRKVEVQRVLNSSRDSALAANKAKLIREKPLETNGVSGIEFVANILEKGKPGVIVHQVFFSAKSCRLYQAIVTGPNGIESRPEAKAFLGSFEGLQ